jgi:hypothetical protein
MQLSPTWKKNKKRPLRTFNEVAEILGVTPETLGGYMARHPNHPKRALDLRGGNARVAYYDPNKMKDWWDSIKGSTGNLAKS